MVNYSNIKEKTQDVSNILKRIQSDLLDGTSDENEMEPVGLDGWYPLSHVQPGMSTKNNASYFNATLRPVYDMAYPHPDISAQNTVLWLCDNRSTEVRVLSVIYENHENDLVLDNTSDSDDATQPTFHYKSSRDPIRLAIRHNLIAPDCDFEIESVPSVHESLWYDYAKQVGWLTAKRLLNGCHPKYTELHPNSITDKGVWVGALPVTLFTSTTGFINENKAIRKAGDGLKDVYKYFGDCNPLLELSIHKMLTSGFKHSLTSPSSESEVTTPKKGTQ